MRHSSLLLLLSCAVLLSGCSSVPAFKSASKAPAGSAKGLTISGRVHGGQNPISGARVYLYAVNDTGYAGPGIPASSSNAAVSLLLPGTMVTTASDGSFTITGDYTCAAATPYVYLLAVGGDAGYGNNSAITLAAGLGPNCNSILTSPSPPYVVINEVSTIAAAYAAAGFATDATHVSSSNSTLAVRGVEDALAAIENLETTNTGLANTTTVGANGTVPQAEINTLANILAACVNSDGTITGPTTPTPCYTLFYNAENNGTPALDTATAALNIAHNPGANVANLYGLQTANSPFQPDLPPTPNDFTLAINYTGGGLDYPWGIAIDASDDVWVANNGTTGPVSKFNPLGIVLSGSSGFNGGGLFVPISIAVDGTGNVWVPDAGNSKLTELNSSGTAVGSSPFTGGGLDSPNFIAIDALNNIWMTNGVAAEISEFGSTGLPITTSTGYPASNLSGKYIATDTAGNIWVTSSDPGNGGLFEFNSSGQLSGNSPITGSGLGDPQGVAIDASGNVWVANGYGDLSEFNSSGASLAGSGGFTGGGLSGPVGIAIDGAGNVWAANSLALSEFNSSGVAISGSNGFEAPSLDSCVALAIDGSGNVWVTNYDQNAGITEFVGAAAPVVTPMAANLQSPYATNNSTVNRP